MSDMELGRMYIRNYRILTEEDVEIYANDFLSGQRFIDGSELDYEDSLELCRRELEANKKLTMSQLGYLMFHKKYKNYIDPRGYHVKYNNKSIEELDKEFMEKLNLPEKEFLKIKNCPTEEEFLEYNKENNIKINHEDARK